MSLEMTPISICQCCLLVLANGECCDEHDGPEPMNKLAGYWVAPGDGEGGFSWTECEGCGQTLGGDRYEATIIERV